MRKGLGFFGGEWEEMSRVERVRDEKDECYRKIGSVDGYRDEAGFARKKRGRALPDGGDSICPAGTKSHKGHSAWPVKKLHVFLTR